MEVSDLITCTFSCHAPAFCTSDTLCTPRLHQDTPLLFFKTAPLKKTNTRRRPPMYFTLAVSSSTFSVRTVCEDTRAPMESTYIQMHVNLTGAENNEHTEQAKAQEIPRMLIHQTGYRQFCNNKYCVARPQTTSRKTKWHTNYSAVPVMANPWVDYAFTHFLHDHNVGGLLHGCFSPRENTHPPTPTKTTVKRVQRITVKFALRPIGR